MKYQAYYKGSKVKAPGWIFMLEKAQQPTVWEQNVAWFDDNFEITDFETWEQNGEHMVTVRFTPVPQDLAGKIVGCIRIAFCRHNPCTNRSGAKRRVKEKEPTLVPDSLFSYQNLIPHSLGGGNNTLVNGRTAQPVCPSLDVVRAEDLVAGVTSFSIEYIYGPPSHHGSFSDHLVDGLFVDAWAIGLMGSDGNNFKIEPRFYTRQIIYTY